MWPVSRPCSGPENWSGRLDVRSGLDGRIVNAGVARYSQFDEHHLIEVQTEVVNDETIALAARTSQSDVEIAEVARTRIVSAARPISPARRVVEEPGFIAHEFSLDADPAEPITIEKIVTLFTSRDRSISDAPTEARSWSWPAG